MADRFPSLRIVLLILLALAAAPDSAGSAAEPPRAPRSEQLHYRWRLEGVSGVLSRLFGLLPTTGDALMALRVASSDRLEVAFTATSEKAKEDEFWKYETAVDLGAWRSLNVRETLHYGKKRKTESFELGEVEVIDVLSGLQRMRYAPPPQSERHMIWSDGRVYPVSVTMVGFERLEFNGDHLTVRHLSIRGLREPDQRFWKARAEMWVTDDEVALPLELLYHMALGRLRMTLVERSPAPGSAGAD